MSQPAEWKSWKLRKRFTIPLAVLDSVIIFAVLFLERTSSNHNGFTTISSISTEPVARFSASNTIWSYGLLWTALPALLMTLYRLAWDSLVSAAADREPFIELFKSKSKDEASSVRRTIMLDYRSESPPYNCGVAFRNRHHILGISMILSMVLSIVLVPLISHLIVAMPIDVLSEITVTISSAFDDGAVSSRTDLQSPMNIAAAVSIFGAIPPPWSTAQYAFEPFDIKDNATSGNVTARVNAYSGLLDCQVKTESELSVTNTSNLVTIHGIDRNCAIPNTLVAFSNLTGASAYALAWSTLQCGPKLHYSRFGIVTGNFSDSSHSSLTHLTVLSCIPSYWKTSGQLTMNIVPGKSPEVLSFSPEENNATEFHPSFYSVVENSLPSYTFFDPSNSIDSDIWGRLVYSMASRQHPENPLLASVIQSSMETLYSSFFASMASTYVFQASENSQQVDALLSEQLTRLVVVSTVAWTVAIIMFLILICNVILIIHSEKSQSILHEEPIGLLGSAVLLNNSTDISDFVAQLCENSANVREKVKKEYPNLRCWYDRLNKRIELPGLPHD